MDENAEVVYELQGYLRNISRMNIKVKSVIPDGIFGEETTESVRSFQEEYELPANGKVDFDTWNKLLDMNNQAIFFFSEPYPVSPLRAVELPLEKGMENSNVYTLKLMLSHIGEKYKNFKKLPIDSSFDEDTEIQVKKWQKVIAVPETGSVDKLTWNLLAEFYLLKEELR